MKRMTKTLTMTAGAVALALAAAVATAHPGGGYGPGWGPGYGMGHMGYGMGYGMGPGGGAGPCYGAGPAGPGMGPGAMGMGPGWGPRGQGPAGPGAGWAGDPAAALDARLASAKEALKITDAQDPAWQAYAKQVKSGVESMRAWRETMHASPPTNAAERSERHTAMLQQRLALSQERSKALKELYDVLSPEQRAVADQWALAMGPGAGMGRGGMGYGGPGMGPGGRWR